MKANAVITLIFFIITSYTNVSADDSHGELNYSCINEKDCRSFGYVCKQNTCQCDQWYIPNKDNKMCVGGVDQKCLYDEHCIEGAYCMNQVTCKCKHDKSQILHQGFICAGCEKVHPRAGMLSFVAFLKVIIEIILKK